MAHCFIYETIVNFNYPVSIIHRSDPVSIRRRHPIGYCHPLALFRREQFPPISLIILYIPGHAFSRPLLYVSAYQIVSSGNVGELSAAIYNAYAGATDIRPKPYALPEPMPLANAMRNASASVTSSTPSKIAEPSVTRPLSCLKAMALPAEASAETTLSAVFALNSLKPQVSPLRASHLRRHYSVRMSMRRRFF